MQNTQREPKEENSRNVRPKPIISSMKQVMQGDGCKTYKNTKLKKAFPIVTIACHKIMMA